MDTNEAKGVVKQLDWREDEREREKVSEVEGERG
jgi:hypothetical protein